MNHHTKKRKPRGKRKAMVKTVNRLVAGVRLAQVQVDFLENANDQKCVLMAMMGFSNHFINRETGLEDTQIEYRLRLAKVKRSSYRNGMSKMSKHIYATGQVQFAQFLAHTLTGALGRPVRANRGKLYLH